MSAPMVFADFQDADPAGRVRLNCNGTIADLKKLNLQLRDGMALQLNDGEEFQTLGLVRYSNQEKIWVAVVNWDKLKPYKPKKVASPLGLLGKTLNIMPSDPWDLVGLLRELPFPGRVIVEGAGQNRYTDEPSPGIVLELLTPLELNGVEYKWMQASAKSLHDLKKAGDRLDVALTCIPLEKYKEGSVDVSWWRGGAAFRGTVELL